ncbi:UvrD-helicase domain-containing protein [Curvibacter sp. AEP1-3]|uniref:UvrD-helicase domain-containing protein n=1 Tax=Curvibacter sp. AEP1-3 TaxID=1844971 RepID=UPI001E56ABD2
MTSAKAFPVQEWRSTAAGRLFTGASDWRLRIAGEQFELKVAGTVVRDSIRALESLRVKPGWFWSSIELPDPAGEVLSLGGISNGEGRRLQSVLNAAIAQLRRSERIAAVLKDFQGSMAPVLEWASACTKALRTQLKMRGWITREVLQVQLHAKPSISKDILETPEVMVHLRKEPAIIQEAIQLWQDDLYAYGKRLNQQHQANQLESQADFFQRVEKSPLTQEQVQAVINFDNRVLLVASAGSGKTSTMVAKAGYALHNGYFLPEQMLLLSFNNDAAKELSQRIKARLQPLGLPAERVVAKTFHAFGLDVIGQATGKKPSLAPWLEGGQDLEHLLKLIDERKDADIVFRTQWDLFRIVLGQDLPKFGKEMEFPDGWNAQTKEEGFWTLNNEVVKSRGEQLIANWLFYNGVKYVYEAAYEVETADAQHRQYRPDFYLTDANAYLEHWALDDNGEPPPEFAGYKEGMVWKKQLHAQHGTTLLETTMADLWSGQAFRYLEMELTKLGLVLDPNPERPAPGRKPIENPRLARTFRSFLTHAKSNRLSIQDLRKRLESGVVGVFRFRHKLFLDLYERISTLWENELQSSGCIDFEDMLNLAADCVEQGRWDSPYQLVMVDEFQDASQARSRLVASLVRGPHKHLFAVGDDWQSINRFAGADLSVMTNFETRFGPTVTMKLEITFRCPQSLCDISSAFVRKNPKQLAKVVRSQQPALKDPVKIVRVTDEHGIRSVIAKRIEEIASTDPKGKKHKILVLGRYKKESVYLPANVDTSRIDLEFITVHSSKGLEADHIILPRVTSETLGFPSKVADDPVLQLAMPSGDDFQYAEERRLFYVALTRARQTVTLVTIERKESLFIAELVREQGISIEDQVRNQVASEMCPRCGDGFLTQRKGKYGHFIACTKYPRCDFTRNITRGLRH